MPARQRVSPLPEAQHTLFENQRVIRCSTCKERKPEDNFVRDKTRKGGRYRVCKACRGNYYQANRQRVLKQANDYRSANRERLCEKQKRYQERRFFHMRAANLRIRAKVECATDAQIARLWKQQRGLCGLTGRKLTRDNAQLDHIIPVVKRGSSTIDNLRWVHRDVNNAKRDLLDADFIALCQEVSNFNIRKE